MSDQLKTYDAEGIKVHWEPNKCKHAAECVKGLPSVFNTQKRPWVSPQNATAEKIMEVIDLCPSRALTYEQK